MKRLSDARLNFRGPRKLNNLGLRILSAIVLGSLVLGVTWLGGPVFGIMIVLFAAALLYEWLGMAGGRISGFMRVALWALLALALIPTLLGFHAAAVLSFVAVALAISWLLGIVRKEGQVGTAGLAYALVSAVTIDQLREGGEAGFAAIVFLFAVVWATDSFAYIVGRLIGGLKLAPSISPGKTWSGALGGALAAIVFGGLAARLLGVHAGFGLALSALCLSVVSQAGDLFESAVKRRFGVKDSGRLIPGHGGVLDRVDGLVAAALALYVIGVLLSGIHEPARGLFYFR